jgi:hypothetical protein
MWTITGAVVMPHFPSHGFCASLEEAKAKFAETWRAWLALLGMEGQNPTLRQMKTHCIMSGDVPTNAGNERSDMLT